MNRKTKEIYKSVLFPIGVLLSALLIWEVASIASGKAEGSPASTMRAVMVLFGQQTFWRALSATLLRSLISFAVSFLFALIFAIMSSKVDTVRRILAPIITTIRCVPTMAVVLILIVTFKASVATVIVGMLVLFPTFYSALLPVVDSVDKQMLEAAEVYRANGWQKIVYVYMPYMRNAVIENALSGISLAIKLIVSAEVISQAARSIGMMMQDSRMYLQSDRLIALTLVIVFICILIDGVGKLVCSGLKKPNKE